MSSNTEQFFFANSDINDTTALHDVYWVNVHLSLTKTQKVNTLNR